MIKKMISEIVHSLGYEIHKVRKAQTAYGADNNFFPIYEQAQQKCQMEETDNILRRQRHYTLNYLLRNTDLSKGDVVELGCWRGLSAYQTAHYLKSADIKTPFLLFDSFQGLSEYEEKDLSTDTNYDKGKMRRHFVYSLEQVQSNLKEFPFIEYFKGWVPARFPEVKDRKFSFVHIDLDMYQPIYDSFQFFYPRLADKGVMVFDDYGCIQFPGAKKAVDECLAQFKGSFFMPLPSGQAFFIKNFYD